MSLEDRFRQAFDDAMAELRSRLDAQFASTLSDVRAEADRSQANALAALEEATRAQLAAAADAQTAALSEAKGSVESALLAAFQSEKAALIASHDAVIAQLREAVESDRSRLHDEAVAEAARLREAADAAAAAARAQLDHATAEAARQREELEAALAQARDSVGVEVEKARAHAGEAAAAHSEVLDVQVTSAGRLLDSVRTLDGAASLTEVLDALTAAAAQEAGRSAMLVVKGDRLIGWRTTGFGRLDDEPRSIESSTSDGDALAAALNTGRPAIVGSGSVLAAPSFSQMSADGPGLAVPLLVAGRPVAVLYADTGAAPTPSLGWTAPVEVLVRHAGRCLEALAVSRGAHARASADRVGSPA